MQLKIGWRISEPVTFEFADNAVAFECGSNVTDAFSDFFKSKDYIWLRQT